jgi:hypothetical protein
MAEPQESDSSDRGDQPGKIRTMWHPLLVRMLNIALGSAFKVEQELYVGKMPLRVDILLIRREGGQLSQPLASAFSALLSLLNRFTLIEFKAPTDAMERGDFAQLVACAYLWHSQQPERVPHDQISLVVLAPTASGALRDDLCALGLEVSSQEPGIFRVAGLPFAAWLVETDVMAEQGQPLLSLVSRLFLNDRESIIEKLAYGPYGRLVEWMVQQVKQFDPEEDSAVQQLLSKNLEELQEELLTKMLERTPRERLLQALSPEERLRGLSPEQILAGVSEEEAARMRELLERKEQSKVS